MDHADCVLHLTKHDLTRQELIAKMPKKMARIWGEQFEMEDAAQNLEEMNTPKRRIYCTVTKDRHASTGLERKPFHIDWLVTDDEQHIKAEYNDYSPIERGLKDSIQRFHGSMKTLAEEGGFENTDDELDSTNSSDNVITLYGEYCKSADTGAGEINDKDESLSSESTVQSSRLDLPASLTALNALSEDEQRKALLKLRIEHGSVKNIAQELNCSVSSIEKRCRQLGVTQKTVQNYAAGISK